MFNLEAEIVPGQSAAGICLGDTIEGILNQIEPLNIVNLTGGIRYEFGPISLWVDPGNKIKQIGLYEGYRGTISNKIRVGSTLRDIQENFGKVFEDEEDNLVVEDFPGWCFETEEWKKGRPVNFEPFLRVIEIYIFYPDKY